MNTIKHVAIKLDELEMDNVSYNSSNEFEEGQPVYSNDILPRRISHKNITLYKKVILKPYCVTEIKISSLNFTI